MPLKTFRAKIEMTAPYPAVTKKGAIHHIRLGTNNGKTGYRIKKFQAINSDPGEENTEAVLQLFKVKPPDGVPDSGIIDFDDASLLGVCYYEDGVSAGYGGKSSIIFESEIINQDIYVTYFDNSTESGANYFLELEQIKLTEQEATVSTMKSIFRNV